MSLGYDVLFVCLHTICHLLVSDFAQIAMGQRYLSGKWEQIGRGNFTLKCNFLYNMFSYCFSYSFFAVINFEFGVNVMKIFFYAVFREKNQGCN